MEDKLNLSFPQVLLLGNGLNRASEGKDWGGLIKRIHNNPGIDPDSDEFRKMPFPLQAVLATEDKVDVAIKNNKEAFCGVNDLTKLKPQLERLLSVGFDHILTTNYSYELERIAKPRIRLDGVGCQKLMHHNSDGNRIKRAEPKYLLHTYNEVEYNGCTNRIWHIHGEARKPDSIILGHYYYGKLLNRVQKLLEDRGNVQRNREQAGKSPTIQSWVDAFIMGDVYILGYGFDWSEMDMWWLLNRKKREKASHGKTIFYEAAGDCGMKHELLRSYGTEICNLGYQDKPNDYTPFYERAIGDIEKRMKKSEVNDHV